MISPFDRMVTMIVNAFVLPSGRFHGAFRHAVGLDLPDDAPMSRQQFTYAIFDHLSANGVRRPEALKLAKPTLEQCLREEQIQFGDPDYCWDRRGAQGVADEFFFQHSEAADAPHP